jgi:hypothetical protein
MQVRAAVGAAPLSNPVWLHTVLLIAIRGLPHAYRHCAASPGSTVLLEVTGPGGGRWALQREPAGWSLWAGDVERPDTHLTVSDDLAWRVFFNAAPDAVSEHLNVRGDRRLAEPFLSARSVIV